jgi:predicted porin
MEIFALQHFGDYKMRKTQVALAAMALVASTAVLANGVTVSGSMDVGVGSFNTSATPNTNRTGMQEGAFNGGSIVTISGKEDLGNGLKAGFTLQSGFNAANGAVTNGGNSPATTYSAANQTVFNRQTNVSLSGDFGTVTAGLQFNQYIAAQTSTGLPGTPFGAFDVSSIIFSGTTGSSTLDAGGFFNRNSVSYVSPSVAGFTAGVQSQLGTGAESMSAGSLVGSVGDIKLGAGFLDRRSTEKALTIGALLPMGDLSFNLRHTRYNPATGADINQVRGGVSYALNSAVTLTAQHAKTSGMTGGTGKLTSLGAYYSMSKATGVYVHYSMASGATQGGAYGGASSTAAASGRSWGVGLVTNF